jgi:hypothetical protein
MPLYDHFHSPIVDRHQWPPLHSRWATAIADDLNRRLPRRFLAEAPSHLGTYISADVAEYREGAPSELTVEAPANGDGGVAVAVETYAPPVVASMPAVFPPVFRVEVVDTRRARQLLAVVELVSPANKKEPDERERFAAKCRALLGTGVGLVVIDIVTERSANLHNLVVGPSDEFAMPGDPSIYAAAYRPVSRKGKDLIDLWHWPLAVGTPLPPVPLPLKGIGCVRLDLEATYAEACERCRIP